MAVPSLRAARSRASASRRACVRGRSPLLVFHRMLRKGAPAIAASYRQSLAFVLHDQRRTLHQAVFFVADLGVFASERHNIRRGIVHSLFTCAALIRSRDHYASAHDEFSDISVTETSSQIRRLQNHILLFRLDMP